MPKGSRIPDFVDQVIEQRTRSNPQFPALLEAALERRRFIRELASRREAAGVSQTAVAAKMGTSQSAVARIESGEADVRMSTIERYATALETSVNWSQALRGPGRGSPVMLSR
ncbi:MAG: helix-turn-helix domain-containing protein [Actinomycetota bacterium]